MVTKKIINKTRTIIFDNNNRKITFKPNLSLNAVVASSSASAPPVSNASSYTAAEQLDYNNIDDYGFDCSPQEPQEPLQSFYGFPDPLLWNNSIDGVSFQANSYKASTQIHVFQDFELVTEAASQTQAESQYAKPKPTYVCIYITNLIYTDLSRKVVTSCSSNECSSSSHVYTDPNTT